MQKLWSWLKFLSAPNIGKTRAVQIIKQIGDPVVFMQDDRDQIEKIDLINQHSKQILLNNDPPDNWDYICKTVDKLNIKFTTILDDDYPNQLKNIYDPPPILFYRGTLHPGKNLKKLAVVGTRKPSNYGKLMAEKITKPLAESGFVIVSGLAAGIDSIAHRTALKNDKPTIAVLGTAIDYIYPVVNRKLAQEIIENGCLISENPPGLKTEKWVFPARNRIISGICSGIFVVEGALKSGALLTAKCALEQNRDIFALPGDINREMAKGPNHLIKLGAKIVTEPNDILEEYNVQLDFIDKIDPDLTPLESEIYDILLANKPEILLDNLLIQSQMSISQLSPILLALELKAMIKKIPGNKIMPVY